MLFSATDDADSAFRRFTAWAVWFAKGAFASNGGHSKPKSLEVVSPARVLGDSSQKFNLHEKAALAIPRNCWIGKN